MADDFQYDVFLSHSKKDMATVQQLAERLKADGLRVWFDQWVIQPGDSIPLAIERGLETSRTLVLVMSENAFASDWVTLERHAVLFRDPTNRQRRFIPLRIDDCDIKESLRQFAYVDWRDKDRDQYRQLVEALRVSVPHRVVEEREATVLRTLRGHFRKVTNVVVTPDGSRVATLSRDGSLRAWDGRTGQCIAQQDLQSRDIVGISITSSGNELLVCYRQSYRIGVLDVESQHYEQVFSADSTGSRLDLTFLAIARDGDCVLYSIPDGIVLWDLVRGLIELPGSKHSRLAAFATRRNDIAVLVTLDGDLQLWDTGHGTILQDFREHASSPTSLALTHDGKLALSGEKDNTLRVWDCENGRCVTTFEGHTAPIYSIAVTADGRFAFSGSLDRTVRVWDLKSSMPVETLDVYDESHSLCIDDDGTVLYASWQNLVNIFEIRITEPEPASSLYTNAKVLLVGDSCVGKSGLAIRLTENTFKPTVSTDAHWATQLRLPHNSDDDGVDREIWLWDFAGQADYRLIHQLFMDETALAVLVFNPQSERPFEGLAQWDRDLTRAARREFAKLLVAGRCDRGGLMVSREAVQDFADRRDFAQYLETSALTGDGCDQLRDRIINEIDWSSIPWTASPRIFKLLKDEILRLRDEDVVMLRMGELKQQLEMRLVGEAFTVEELRAVVGLLAGPGLVWKLEFGDIVMLQPEWVNKYAAAVIRSVRAHIGEIGVIDEARVLAGELNYTMDVVRREADGEDKAVEIEMQRLEPSVEAIVLRAMHQMFVDHGLCVREKQEGGGRQLVFPSYFKQELPTDPGHPPILVNYQFNGHAEEIYATLIVQLWQTKAFENGTLWRYAADFRSPTGARLGLKMMRHEDKSPEISVYFDPEVQDDTRVTFIKYVHEHLLQKAQDVVRLRAFVCPLCGHPVSDTELARRILEKHGKDAEIRCQDPMCDRRFSLWDVIEQKFASKEFQERVEELEQKAKAAIDNESRELILEGHARVITGEAGQIYRGYTGSDYGIDGEIEFKNDSGQASGKRLYLQLKSGDSYLYKRKSDGAEVFQIKKPRWAEYWRSQAYPVMLVIRTSGDQIRWMNVTEYLQEHSKDGEEPVKQIVFDGEPFTAVSVQRFRDQQLSSRE